MTSTYRRFSPDYDNYTARMDDDQAEQQKDIQVA